MPAADDTRVANFALRHLGVSKTVQNIVTEQSEEATAVRDFIDFAKEEVLRDFQHPFTTEIATLSLVSEDPTTEYRYAYQYPSNCAKFRRILSGIRNDTRQTRVHYRIVKGSSGKLIYTDQSEAVGEYSVVETETGRWPIDLVMALSLLIASYIAPSVTDGDPFKLGERAMRLYVVSKTKAESNALNEEQSEEDPESEFIRER